MRIVGGRFKGRKLAGPLSPAIRPTSDRLRESVFDILAHGYADPVVGARVIDLFAGSGALGLEAISRGARFALFVDKSAEARSLIRANSESLGLGGVTKILRRDATRLGAAPSGEPFTLAFLDPPYGMALVLPALVALRDGLWLASGALAVIEEAADVALALPEGYALLERRVYGDTQIVFSRTSR